jgi:hypothetical protein
MTVWKSGTRCFATAVIAVQLLCTRRTDTFACAQCAVVLSARDAARTEHRHVRKLATNHALHGLYVDRTGQPYAVSLFDLTGALIYRA